MGRFAHLMQSGHVDLPARKEAPNHVRDKLGTVQHSLRELSDNCAMCEKERDELRGVLEQKLQRVQQLQEASCLPNQQLITCVLCLTGVRR